MTEQWVDVEGYDGRYQVSNMGRVRSVDRLITAKAGWQTMRRGRILKNVEGNHGYPIVSLWRNNKNWTPTVHRLVLEHFVGPRPEGYEACHENGIKMDPRLSNLRWDTGSVNNLVDKERHGTLLKGERIHQSKLTGGDVARIREIYKAGGRSQQSIADEYGVAQQTIGRAISGKHWKHTLDVIG